MLCKKNKGDVELKGRTFVETRFDNMAKFWHIFHHMLFQDDLTICPEDSLKSQQGRVHLNLVGDDYTKDLLMVQRGI